MDRAGPAAPEVAEHVLAPAKLTLSLRIAGVRDDGFHLIDAEMVTLDLFDELWLTPAAETTITVDGQPDLEVDASNLVARALALAGRPAHVRLLKRIPAGAGLGGGSADAAAALRWCGYDDVVGAAGIGADVAFCLVGGRALVRGMGEIVEPQPFVAQTFTLLTPELHCPTPAIYARWDALGGPTGPRGNDLEAAAVDFEPRLALARDELGEATGRQPRLAGSGSTWFVEGAYPGPGRVVATTIPASQ
ncbi:MAG: 4-(cytidine 5'-diphospho)-2-C-methyl-D-erythritol kinase [Acidimicrobiales bacterium]|nr:4-(cytidine 5'-diphospho)-2-C-methyl-D-erythritol kinase [Acidimicrobiales bacterium]